MRTLARSIYLDSEFGVIEELPKAGSALENAFVFDDAAKEMKAMAAQGLVEIVEVHTQHNDGDVLVDRLKFKRLR
jgi:hypothetical protein